MRRLWVIFFVIFCAVILSGCDRILANAKVGLQITSTPTATVYVNDQKIGSTPFNSFDLKPGSYSVKLASGSAQWGSQVKLNSQTVTIVNRVFASKEQDEAGEILSMEKGSGIWVISIPDKVEVTIDSSPVGTTPVNVKDVPNGSHRIVVAKDGYLKRAIQVQTHPGYATLVNVQLSKEKVELVQTATASANLSPQVQVLQTPTGWLRVRSEPSFGAAEISKINTGEKYQLLSTQPDWVQIQLLNNKTGWVSSQFVKKVE